MSEQAVHRIIFSGHMIDKKSQARPRFPASKEKIVKISIREVLSKEKYAAKNNIQCFAGGACGGDILFHEVCQELTIPSEIILSSPVENFMKQSVSICGSEWKLRLEKLLTKLHVHQINENAGEKKGINIYELINEELFKRGMEKGKDKLTLIALWDGEKSNQKGGTYKVIETARNLNINEKIINIKKLKEI